MAREFKYDTMKALLIYLVVFGHILSRFAYTEEAGRIIYNVIYSFHMPAFLFISGYFAKPDPKPLFRKFIPLYIIFQIVNFIVRYAISYCEGSVNIDSEKLQFINPGFTLWYMPAIMIYQLLIPLFISNNFRRRSCILAVSFAVGIYMGFEDNFNDVLSLQRIICFLPFYIMGFYEKQSHSVTALINKYSKLAKFITLMMFSIVVIVICINSNTIEQDWLWHTENYESSGCTWFIRLLLYFAGIIGILTLLAWIPSDDFKTAGFIGRNTLQIYLFHAPIVLLFEAFDCFRIFDNNVIILAIVSLFLTFVLAHFRLPHICRTKRLMKIG